VKAAIAKGVGALLQNVSVEDVPEFRDKKFYGFKLRGLTGRWAGAVDLQPGDVIRKVNGIVIERPEHAVAALKALETAPALEIEYERAGKPGVIELPIVGD
jgi:general secretion pathway protein C